MVGQRILMTGEMKDKIFFIKHGHVNVYVHDYETKPDPKNPRKGWIKVASLEKGSCFNIVSCIL